MDPSKHLLLVTGATGYVGGNIIQEALAKGYHVRAQVRKESGAAKLSAMFPNHQLQLSYTVVPDITDPEAYETALASVTGVIHLASPLNFHPKDLIKDTIEPAINGSLAILEATKRYGACVTRVIATSSFAACIDLSQGTRPGYVYDDKDWNPITYKEAVAGDGLVAYIASKTFAERAMWDWMDKNKPSFSLTTITPPWLFGPYAGATGLTTTKGLCESVQLLWDILDAEEVPPFDYGGYCDVRDAAAAHVLAYEVPEAGGQRYWVGHCFQYQPVVDIVRAEMPGLKSRIPEGKPGYLEDVYKVDGSRPCRELGLTYRSMKETMTDTFEQFLHAEAFEARG